MGRTRPPSTRRVKTSKLRPGRPPLLSTNDKATTASGGTRPHQHQSQSHSQSSRHTRSIIRAHHVLQKQLARAKASDDETQIAELERQLAEAGGLRTYQLASTVGQSASRGGDSSRVLVEWMRDEIEPRRQSLKAKAKEKKGGEPQRIDPLHILEVGALSTQNALNIPGVTSVRRIDLRSSGVGIEECDFMDFPTPSAADGSGEWLGRRGYDVLSLSLVLNYVPDAKGRGDMLRRTTEFLSERPTRSTKEADEQAEAEVVNQPLVPSLFLVLPAPCLHNSRYLTPRYLELIMSSLGYSLANHKTTQKLYYSLWHYDFTKREESRNQWRRTPFPKKEINPGGGRNNFCIVVDHDA
ncbi:hypothetical protein LTR84_002904 [Exophiala bonariae]|uniref:25S rRNA adenine-N(1) methyltransferase n=1 Tax=Exophiala bonariae TaxID=1690606 RepID=A0AAV9NBD9_9EURO|nr:hypothetical protein LTR84_002904 [Exophiala bonariae]